MTLSGSRCSSFELFVFFWAVAQKPAEITREGGPRDKVHNFVSLVTSTTKVPAGSCTPGRFRG